MTDILLSKITAHRIPSRDGFLLGATLVEPSGEVKGCIQINSATGARKEIYLNLARYLAENGWAVLLFDYRGIGESKPKTLKGFHAHCHDWGYKDMAAALDWLDAKFPTYPKFVIGHSAGGQQLGFMDNHRKISKAFLVSASIGYWKLLASPYRYFTLLVWFVLRPITNTLAGYTAASWFGLGEDLPKGVANEWKRWCMRRNYYGDFLGKELSPVFFDDIRFPIHFIYPEDDTIATFASVQGLQAFYKSADITTEEIQLKEYGLQKMGHFGFFSRASRNSMWPKVLAFFENR